MLLNTVYNRVAAQTLSCHGAKGHFMTFVTQAEEIHEKCICFMEEKKKSRLLFFSE